MSQSDIQKEFENGPYRLLKCYVDGKLVDVPVVILEQQVVFKKLRFYEKPRERGSQPPSPKGQWSTSGGNSWLKEWDKMISL